MAILIVLLQISFSLAMAQETEKQKTMELYGHVMTDVGYNFNQVAPDWFDVMRPTRLPSFKNEFGSNGNTYFSVRQSRVGIKTYTQTPLGELKTHLEVELFGTGVDAGQTTIRLRHAYAELGKFGVGQYWSPFMDIDVFPNTLEYWGPSGMVFFRNIQIRYMPIQGDTRLTFALERPGASADEGFYADRIELDDVKGRFPVPDLSAEYHVGRSWGYVEIAGMVRRIEWIDLGQEQFDLSGKAIGFGINLSSNVNLGSKSVFRGQLVYGEGIQNYMNDAPTDIAFRNNFSDPNKPIVGEALPVVGIVAFLDHRWNDKFTSSIGYSSIDVANTDAQRASAFSKGQYAVANLIYYPVPNMLAGVELQWIGRENFYDGWTSNATKVQFSFKYNFSQTFYKN
jgi:hypothetical protein